MSTIFKELCWKQVVATLGERYINLIDTMPEQPGIYRPQTADVGGETVYRFRPQTDTVALTAQVLYVIPGVADRPVHSITLAQPLEHWWKQEILTFFTSKRYVRFINITLFARFLGLRQARKLAAQDDQVTPSSLENLQARASRLRGRPKARRQKNGSREKGFSIGD